MGKAILVRDRIASLLAPFLVWVALFSEVDSLTPCSTEAASGSDVRPASQTDVELSVLDEPNSTAPRMYKRRWIGVVAIVRLNLLTF